MRIKVGISERDKVVAFEWGMVPAIFTATIKPFSKPILAEKIHTKPKNPAPAVAKATRTPIKTKINITNDTITPIWSGSAVLINSIMIAPAILCRIPKQRLNFLPLYLLASQHLQ